MAMKPALGVIVLVLAAQAVDAQVPYQGGQWSLPYELGAQLKDDGDGNPGTFWPTFEIAHVLLAPPSRVVGQPRSDRVLLQCVPGGGCLDSNCTYPTADKKMGRLYRWTPRTPTNATLISVPSSYPQDGSQDLFCGGHTFLANGDLIWVGGTDKKAQCADCPSKRFFGHAHAWRLDLGLWDPAWVPASTSTNKMAYARWYPTATLMNDGMPWVHGHTAQPAQDQDARRDVLTNPLGTYQWAVADNSPWSSACNLTTLVDLEDYPRLHLLSTGELFWSAAYEQIGVGTSATFVANASKFLDVKLQPWSC